MKELITIHPDTPINNKLIPTVSARDLHRFMEVGRVFAAWIKGRIEEFEYEEGRDFIVITGSPDLANGLSEDFSPVWVKRQGEFFPDLEKTPTGRPSIEYYLTLDMAKELAMVERNPMGRLARKYFIRCEQKVFETLPVLQAELLKERPLWRKIGHYKEMGLNNVEVGRLVQVSKDTVRRHSRLMEQCGLAAKRELKKPSLGAERQLPLFSKEVAQ